MLDTLKVSELPKHMSGVRDAVTLLIRAGYDKANTSYMLALTDLAAKGLSLDTLEMLLKTGLPHTSTQKGVIPRYDYSPQTAEVAFRLNYDLVP